MKADAMVEVETVWDEEERLPHWRDDGRRCPCDECHADAADAEEARAESRME
jgi:hypothetical protein